MKYINYVVCFLTEPSLTTRQSDWLSTLFDVGGIIGTIHCRDCRLQLLTCLSCVSFLQEESLQGSYLID